MQPSIDTAMGKRYLNPYNLTYIPNRTYALRLQRGWRRGFTLTQARRGRETVTGAHEYALRVLRREARRELEAQQAVDTEVQRNYAQFRHDFLMQNGFTYDYWIYLYKHWIRAINQMAWGDAPTASMHYENGQRQDPRVFPADVASARSLYEQGFRDPVYPVDTWQEWIENRLQERLSAIYDYQEMLDARPGRSYYYARRPWIGNAGFAAASPPPLELWYYH